MKNGQEMVAEILYKIGNTREEILMETREGRYDLIAFSPEKDDLFREF